MFTHHQNIVAAVLGGCIRGAVAVATGLVDGDLVGLLALDGDLADLLALDGDLEGDL